MSAAGTGRYAALILARGAVRVAVIGTALFGLTGAILAPAVATLFCYPLLILVIRPYAA